VANQNLNLLDIYILSKGEKRRGDKKLLLGEITDNKQANKQANKHMNHERKEMHACKRKSFILFQYHNNILSVTPMAKFTLDVPDEFLKDFDEAIKRKYQTRNEAIRDGMRLLAEKLKEEEKKWLM